MSYSFSLDSDSIMGDLTFLLINFKYIVMEMDMSKEMIKKMIIIGEEITMVGESLKKAMMDVMELIIML